MSRHRIARPRTTARRQGFSLVAVLSMLAAMITVTTLPSVAPQAAASVQQTFTASYNAQVNGAITVIGNSQMTCPTAATGCTAARAVTPDSKAASTSNNDFAMQFIDADVDAGTTNSTSADLAVPAGSTVLYAALTWGGRSAGTTGDATKAKLRVPGSTGYQPVTGTLSSFPALGLAPYYSTLDVTNVVKTAGNGTYFVADLVASTGADKYAGWSLSVVYSNPSFPLRDLRVYQGFADVSTGNSVDIPINGLLTPPAGAVNASVGFVVWEGDAGFVGDAAALVNATRSARSRMRPGRRPTSSTRRSPTWASTRPAGIPTTATTWVSTSAGSAPPV